MPGLPASAVGAGREPGVRTCSRIPLAWRGVEFRGSYARRRGAASGAPPKRMSALGCAGHLGLTGCPVRKGDAPSPADGGVFFSWQPFYCQKVRERARFRKQKYGHPKHVHPETPAPHCSLRGHRERRRSQTQSWAGHRGRAGDGTREGGEGRDIRTSRLPGLDPSGFRVAFGYPEGSGGKTTTITIIPILPVVPYWNNDQVYENFMEKN